MRDHPTASGRRALAALLCAGLLTAACGTASRRPPAAVPPPAAAAGALTVLSVNDTYRVEGLDGGARGGLARVRALRRQLEAAGEEVLVLHAGDLLYPSLESRRFGGAQIIDLMNLLDGDDRAFDDRLFATFGNHEFERSRLADAAGLARRVRQSRFRWLATNLSFASGDDGAPLVAAANLLDDAIVEVGGLRVGLFSLTTDYLQPDYVTAIADPVETARRAVAGLRSRGAEVVVALTHLALDEDRALLAALGAAGPDVVIGGHDHEAQTVAVGGRWIVKADADAATARLTRIQRLAGGGVRVDPRPAVALDASGPDPDPAVATRAREWRRASDLAACAVERGLPPDCLDLPLGLSRTGLVGEELAIRRYETDLGNWVADLALASFADRGAQVAFINAGSLRLNQNIAPGAPVLQRHVEELFAYPTRLALLEIDGATLASVVGHAVERWSAEGWWLQISGFAFRHDPARGTAGDLTLLAPDGRRAIAPGERLRVVTTDFLAAGNDGYSMLGAERRIARGPDLEELVVAALARAGEEGIAPRVEGRICNPERPGPCLAVDAPGDP